MIRSTSNSSISSRALNGNGNNNKNTHNILAPPSLDPDNASVGTSSTPLLSPLNNASNFLFNDTTTTSTPKVSPKIHPSATMVNNELNKIQPDPQNPYHRKSLPHPLPPSKCPLLCVFYAEFDIVVGPKVCFQSPQKFMHFDVDVDVNDVHTALEETFDAVLPKDEQCTKKNQKQKQNEDGAIANNVDNVDRNDNQKGHNQQQCNGKDNISPASSGIQVNPDDYWNWSPNTRAKRRMEREQQNSSSADDKSQTTLPTNFEGRQNSNTSTAETEGGRKPITTKESLPSNSSSKPSHRRKQSGVSIVSVTDATIDDSTTNNNTTTTAQQQSSSHSRNPSFASSSKNTIISNQPTHDTGDNSTIDTEFLQNSIFAATSEYIITGNELANQTITVSTHGMHILSRPMIICDTQRYERNSLLFAVGFVLRRNVDPRPYWPVLSNLSTTFRAMEVESEFLSHYKTRSQIQIVLEDILVSLNSKERDCHLLLDDANLLNLHLFRPPPPPTPPVPDYAVPILLKPEWKLQMYDWDLTINWIVPQIDGCKYVKQIANSTEVDMEMVRACLRVLRHHGVLSYVDVFRYCNIYECQNVALFDFDGKTTTDKKAEAKKLLDAAFWYCAKAKYVRRAQQMYHDAASNERNSSKILSSSPSHNIARRLHLHMSSLHSLDLSVPWSSDTPVGETSKRRTSITESMSAPRSFPSRTGHITIREGEEHLIDEDASPDISDNKGAMGDHLVLENSSHLKEINMMKSALAQLYSSCNRSQSFSEMFLSKMEDDKKEDTPLYVRQRSQSIERTVSQSFVDSTLSPLRESSEAEVVADIKKENTLDNDDTRNENIDWKRVFDYFDHRRLVTFGVIKGIIKRVHQYPLAYEIKTSGNDDASSTGNVQGSFTYNRSGGDHEDGDDFSTIEQYQIEMSAIVEEAAAVAAKMALDEQSRQSAYSASPSYHPSSPLLQGITSPHLNSTDGILLNKLTQKAIHLNEKKKLMERIALAMDGTRCDDEISCMFEEPIEKLIEMLQASGRWQVISVFSCIK